MKLMVYCLIALCVFFLPNMGLSMSRQDSRIESRINALQTMNPMLPFSFTYDYRSPRPLQVEFFVGTFADVENLSRVTSDATGLAMIPGAVGFKAGLPGDLTIIGSWPWLGAYFSTPEQLYWPEFDISVMIPLAMQGAQSRPFVESYTMNLVAKKSLPPLRFSLGYNILVSPQFLLPDHEGIDQEIGQTYVGVGVEGMVNPFLRLMGEYRFQMSSWQVFLDPDDEAVKYTYEWFPLYPNSIIGIGLEYVWDTPGFTMKSFVGYSLRVSPPNPEIGITFGSQGFSIGFTFLFALPMQ